MKRTAFVLVLSLLSVSVVTADDWKIVPGRITTEFAKQVDPKQPLPEYPRPQLERDAWLNLNGLWDYAVVAKDAHPAEKPDGKILVPYPIESALSGVGKEVGTDKILSYNRTFNVPAAWNGKRVVLHFGAVDWSAIVAINGKEVGRHTGGYTPFSFDITDQLKKDGEQRIDVTVTDPTDDSWQPRGKQVNKPNSIWYTAVTGIWQTVWLEPVEETHINSLKFVTEIKDNTLTIDANISGLQDGDKLEATVLTKVSVNPVINRRPFMRSLQGNNRRATALSTLSSSVGKANEPLVLKIPNAKLWTPDEPNLYDLKISVIRDGKAVDTVKSYFGMREITLGKTEDGITRMLLNGKFLFQHGLLDQGWFPDGLYTAATDKALLYDLEVTKKLGFNMLRKHVKVEPARFYYHCDKLGLLVWQDMPSGDKYIGDNDPDFQRSPESAANYEKEWREIINANYNSPSIVVWVPFNEGWGQFDTGRILALTKQIDPTRLVDGPSGWTDRGYGDMYDMHAYRGPGMFPPEEKRASVLGEYGGLGLPIQGHMWVESDQNWGYGNNLKDHDDLLNTYIGLNERLHPLIAKGLSAAVYTQTTDVEIESNGLMTYDRKVIKVDAPKFKASMDSLHYPAPKTVTVLPTAAEKESEWSYTTDKPAEGWEKADFDASAWKKGKGGFGTKGTPNAAVRTEWNTSDIWIRREVGLSAVDVKDPSQLKLDLYHDEDAEVYINGVKVFDAKGYVPNYTLFPLINAAKAFKAGTHYPNPALLDNQERFPEGLCNIVIAIHCKQTSGEQYIDTGIIRVEPVNKKKRAW